MKKTILILSLLTTSVVAFNFTVAAQEKNDRTKKQIDPIAEDSLKNLRAARLYFITRKAYRAALMRCEETIAANPNFAQMDEILYIYAMSSLYLADNKGTQKIELAKLSDEDKKRFAPAHLREDAIATLHLLAEKYPNSDFANKARKTLSELGETDKSKK
jgi:outer membrane protein assembly factor BamD (BamD/ComL family)